MRKITVVCTLVGALLRFGSSVAEAEPVRLELTFTTEGVFGGSEELLGASVAPGSTFSGIFTYESTSGMYTPGIYLNSAFLRLDTGSRLNVAMSTEVGNNVQCEAPCDTFRAGGSMRLDGFLPGAAFTFVFAAPASAIATHALPPSATDFLAAFQTGRFAIYGTRVGWEADGPSHEIFGTVQASDATLTPEPGSLLLLGSGLLGVLRAVRRRRDGRLSPSV